MPRTKRPFYTPRRNDSGTFQVTLTPSCGLPRRVCQEWTRQSFQRLPDSLAQYRYPKTRAAAQAAALALIQLLQDDLKEGNTPHERYDDMTAGTWIEKFTMIEISPRTARNAAKNRPYSPDTLETYKSYYRVHIKDDPLSELKMAEIEEMDVLAFISRLSLKKLFNGKPMVGTRTFAGVIIFVRMAFREYQKAHARWLNPFQNIDPPTVSHGIRDALPEEEVLKLFVPGVLKDTMELAICSAMFLSGLRRSELFALKPNNLDWRTPKIVVEHAWQNFDRKNKVLGPPKGKKEREAPFDPIVQNAIRKLWAENGEHEYVFCYKDGSLPGASWIHGRFPGWLSRAGIELNGREIVPHSSRHSLASLLEERGIPLRYIQELLGHSDFTTTKGYLHSTKKTIRVIGQKITDAMDQDKTRVGGIPPAAPVGPYRPNYARPWDSPIVMVHTTIRLFS